jgi:hypothetical protein
LWTAKKRKKSTENVGALEYALPFKKFYQRNDENRIFQIVLEGVPM